MSKETLRITRLGHLGDGIAKTGDGRVIYAPDTLPDEEIEADVTGARAENIRILSPSPARVRPPCQHARACGGCALQHARDDVVADWKMQILAQALAGQGITAPIRPILTSPPRSRRIATLAARRGKKGAMVGFHAKGSDVIVPIQDCHLLPEAMTALLPDLAQITMIGASRSANLALRMTLAEGGVDLAVTGGKSLTQALRMELAQAAPAFLRLTWEGEPVFMDSPPIQIMGDARIAPPAGAFLQATREGQAGLVGAVREALAPALASGLAIVDLFAGCGTFSLPLASQSPIHAVEADAEMLSALDRAARQTPSLRPVTIEARDLFRRPLLPDELSRFGAAVIDPPRAGAEAQCAALARARLPLIAMVSCNPITFARDAKILCDAGYRLAFVQPVDQFRWSPHLELAAGFALPHMTA